MILHHALSGQTPSCRPSRAGEVKRTAFGGLDFTREHCRRLLHVVAATHGAMSICYFSLVLTLKDDELWGSALLISGLAQFTATIGGLLAARMWIYTRVGWR